MAPPQAKTAWVENMVLSASASAPDLKPKASNIDVKSVHMMSAEDGIPVMYASPSFYSRFADLEDAEPGPGAYDGPSSIGLQANSLKSTAPAYALTDRNAEAWAKVVISKGHHKAMLSRDTPGAGSYQPERPRSQASVRFGVAKRSEAPGMKPAGFESPGPVYDCRGGPMDCTAEGRFAARPKIGKDRRFTTDEQILSHTSLGPGQYESGTAFDGLRLSKTFGCSHRAYDNVITPGFERFLVGKLSPGPGPYREDFARSSKAFAVPKAERLADKRRQLRTPGPGSYDDHEKTEIARLSTMDSQKKTPKSCAFGKPSRKARLDFRALNKFSSSCWGLN